MNHYPIITRRYQDKPPKFFYHRQGQLAEAGGKERLFDHELPVVRVGDLTGLWSGSQLYQIGDRVQVTFNGLGTGTVIAFFKEDDFIGVEVQPDQRPQWHIQQNHTKHPTYLVFGNEITPL